MRAPRRSTTRLIVERSTAGQDHTRELSEPQPSTKTSDTATTELRYLSASLLPVEIAREFSRIGDARKQGIRAGSGARQSACNHVFRLWNC